MTRLAVLVVGASLAIGLAAPTGAVAATDEDGLVAHAAKKCKKKRRHRKCRRQTAPAAPAPAAKPPSSTFHVPTREEALAAMFRDMVSYFNQYYLIANPGSPGEWWAEIQDGGPVDVPGLTGTTVDTCTWIPWSGTRSLRCLVVYWRKNASECNFTGHPGKQWFEYDWTYITRPIYAGATEMTTDYPIEGNEYLCVF